MYRVRYRALHEAKSPFSLMSPEILLFLVRVPVPQLSGSSKASLSGVFLGCGFCFFHIGAEGPEILRTSP